MTVCVPMADMKDALITISVIAVGIALIVWAFVAHNSPEAQAQRAAEQAEFDALIELTNEEIGARGEPCARANLTTQKVTRIHNRQVKVVDVRCGGQIQTTADAIGDAAVIGAGAYIIGSLLKN